MLVQGGAEWEGKTVDTLAASAEGGGSVPQ